MKQKKQTGFISEIDQFLQHFDKTHTQKSLSQLAEIQKYKRVYRLRDQINTKENRSISNDWFNA